VKKNGGDEAVMALLDSGADYTQIPTATVTNLGLKKKGDRLVDRKDGLPPTSVPTYVTDIILEGVTFRDVLVSGTDDFGFDGTPWALVGRDILNEGVILDGPRKWFTVTDPSSASVAPVPPSARPPQAY